MAFDHRLARRIRDSVGSLQDVSEKKMFGGLAFMLGNKMFCGIVGDAHRQNKADFPDALEVAGAPHDDRLRRA